MVDASIAAACLYFLVLQREGYFPPQYGPLVAIVALVVPSTYHYARAYEQLRMGGIIVEAQLVFRGWVATLALLVTIAFATKTSDQYSRQVLAQWAVSTYAAQMLVRIALRLLLQGLRARGLNTRSAVIFGTPTLARSLAALLARNNWLGIRVLGYVPHPADDAGEGGGDGADAAASLAVLTQADATAVIAADRVDQVYIALPMDQALEIELIARRLMAMHVDVHWVLDLSAFPLLNHGVREIEGQPIVCLSDSPLGGGRWVGKWILDMVLASAFLLVAAPVMAAIAVAVKASSPGPVLFVQRRGGLDGREIVVWKFRTMRTHREEEGALTQARRGDPRVTRVGAFLRATSLDELPQLVNVLQGRMSIVGPRPHALEHDCFYRERIDSYLLRHRIKPGITGWAQVNGFRGETEALDKMELRVKYDLYYINNWSIWFDLKIIVLTLLHGVVQRNAF